MPCTSRCTSRPHRRPTVLLVSVLGVLVSVGAAAAQTYSPVSVEARVGGAMGSYEPAAAEANWGQKPAVAVSVAYGVSPRFSVLVGYSRASFRCEGGFCREAEVDFVSRGWDGGIQLGGPRGFWARGGGNLHTLDIPASPTGNPRLTSGRSLGGYVAAGYGIGLSSRLALSPGLRYARYGASFPGESGTDRVDYLVADLGLSFRF